MKFFNSLNFVLIFIVVIGCQKDDRVFHSKKVDAKLSAKIDQLARDSEFSIRASVTGSTIQILTIDVRPDLDVESLDLEMIKRSMSNCLVGDGLWLYHFSFEDDSKADYIIVLVEREKRGLPVEN